MSLTVILAGGQSRRMGRDKAMLPCGEATLLQRLINRYSAIGQVAASVDVPGRFEFRGALELADRYPGMGPLNGLVSAFSQTDADAVFLTATDSPDGSVELARRLLSGLDGYDACVIELNGRLEPAFAAYSRSCLSAAQSCLDSGRRSFRAMLDMVRVNVLSPETLPDFDLSRILMNMNTPESYEAWLSGNNIK